MIRRLVIVLLLFVPATRGQEARVRTSLGAGAEIWAGQKVVLAVELLASGYFAGSPFFDLPKVPGVLVLPDAGSPEVSSESVGDAMFTVQRYELAVIARHAGEIAIPPFEVRFDIKRNPLDHDTVPQTVKTPPVAFTAKAPPGSRPGEDILTSADLTVVESWKPEPGKNAMAGDAFVRTITWSASDLPGMAFPPFHAQSTGGIGIYPSEPEVTDSEERGVSHGGRREQVTYLCKTAGHAVIPAWSVRWWNPATKETQLVEFSERTLEIAGLPVGGPPDDQARQHDGREFAVGCLIATVVGSLLWLRRARLARLFQRLLPRHLPPLNPDAR
jgi:hypothetical protein